jgi:hypothetical protein
MFGVLSPAHTADAPDIGLIFVDDMGYGDFHSIMRYDDSVEEHDLT